MTEHTLYRKPAVEIRTSDAPADPLINAIINHNPR